MALAPPTGPVATCGHYARGGRRVPRTFPHLGELGFCFFEPFEVNRGPVIVLRTPAANSARRFDDRGRLLPPFTGAHKADIGAIYNLLSIKSIACASMPIRAQGRLSSLAS